MSSGTLKRFVNDPVFWTAFLEEIEESIQLQYKKLEQSNDPIDLYRCQGEIFALKRLKQMRDKYNG